MINPEQLQSHYTKFDVANRLLLTGHSHQAWPDVAFEGVSEGLHDAALHVDNKWEHVFKKYTQVTNYYQMWLADLTGHYTLATNTHELFTRLLSACDWKNRSEIVTTTSEFHSARRQLDRISEEGIKVIKVDSELDREALLSQMEALISERTACVFLSAVLFDSSKILIGKSGHNVMPAARLAQRCQELNVPLIIDVYHALGPIEFPLAELGLESAYILGGGYKYLQLGEGCCFLRSPKNTQLRPLITGWFAEFSLLHEQKSGEVLYPNDGNRFIGSTFEPLSLYRAARVIEFFSEIGLTPQMLNARYSHQIQFLTEQFDQIIGDRKDISYDRQLPHYHRAGFLSLKTESAAKLQRLLAQEGVLTDSRGSYLRLGPAPYMTDEQLQNAVTILKSILSH